jgi:hypothetical protein
MFLEFSNILALYFRSYLVNWVAGTKLIFLALLAVILLFGTPMMHFWSLWALMLSISTFYWKLYPLVKKMDKEDQLTPKGYSKQLGVMITIMLLVFLIIFTYTIIQVI